MRTQVARLAKATVIYGIGQALGRFLSLLLLPLFTAYLTPKDYGISSILGVVAFLVTPVFSLGLGAGMGPCYFEGDDRRRKDATIWTAASLMFASAAILAVLGLMFSRQVSVWAFGSVEYSYLVSLSLLTTGLSILTIPFTLSLQFDERAIAYVVLALISTATTIGFSIVGVVTLRRGVQGLVEAGLLGQAATFLMTFFVAVRNLRFRVSRPLIGELLRLSLPLVPAFAFVFVLQQGNKYALQRFHGLPAVGIYSIGFNFGTAVSIVVTGFTNAWMPYFMSFSENRDAARTLFGRILTYYVIGFGAVAACFFIAARPVVMVATQAPFHDAYRVIGLTACGQVLLGIFSILLPGVYFSKETQYLTAVQAAAAAIAVVLDVMLIPPFGIVGAALALMIGTLLLVVLQHAWNAFRRRSYLAVTYEWARVGKATAGYAALAAPFLWPRAWPLAAECAFTAAGFCTLGLWLYFGALDAQERAALWAVVRRQNLPLAAHAAS